MGSIGKVTEPCVSTTNQQVTDKSFSVDIRDNMKSLLRVHTAYMTWRKGEVIVWRGG